ncbi:TolC family protein [Mangrovimonas xylaniphaga]|uniref:TolC family protein n=1 Tax=Mangrovimonas xylaniphaga TaxID=1645915 RepID=UPI0006B455BC|nr:TolC family protein [Mangrovimonas xylaniphaga]
MKIYFSILIALLTTIGQAQEHAQEIVKKWSLEECIAYATTHNITVKDALYSQDKAQLNYDQSKYNKLPNVTGSASQTLSNGNSIDPITSDYVTKQIHSSSFGINSSLTVYEGSKLNKQQKQQQLIFEQNTLYVEETQNNITLQVTEAYLQALYMQEGIAIAENNLEASQQEATMAKAKLDAGSIPMQDYTDATSQAATKKYDLITAKNNYAQQITTLKQLLELDPETEFAIETPDHINEMVETQLDKIEVYKKALSILPEIKATELNKAISEKDIEIAKSDNLPSLYLNGSLGSGFTSTQELNFVDQINVNFNQRIGLSLNIPIFNKNQTKTEIKLAKINAEQTDLELQNVKKDLYKKVDTAWQNSIASQEQLLAAGAAKDAAEESYKLAKKKFELNALNTSDLVVSQNNYTNAQLDYIKAKYLNILYYQLLQFYQGNAIEI